MEAFQPCKRDFGQIKTVVIVRHEKQHVLRFPPPLFHQKI